MKASKLKWLITLFVFGVGLTGNSQSAIAQDNSKDIGVVSADELVGRDGSSGKTSGQDQGKPRGAVRKYRSPSGTAFTKRPARPEMEFAGVGVTIRRLQKADGSKSLDQVGDEALEQISTDAALNIGSNVRIYLEPIARDGFLYVIDREKFADGTYGEAKLIFPTLRTRKGNNRVRLKDLIQIPAPPAYFRINPSSTGMTQVAEVLTIIISPTSLDLPQPLSDRAMTLSSQLFALWAKWAVAVTPFRVEGGAGQVESAKSLDQVGEEAQLGPGDPLPETVFRASVIKGKPLVVTVPLKFKSAQ